MKRVRIAVVAAIALTVGLLVWPHTQPAVSAAEKVRQSLQQANTWHLRGWKLLDGKQVAWEVWGRRTPFFYREQIGAETVLDDGHQRVRILAPWPEAGRSQGIALRTPSQPNADRVGLGFTRSFFEETAVARMTQQDAADDVIFETPDDYDRPDLVKRDIYTISKRTWLPVRYDVRAGSGAQNRIVEHLDPEYDVPLAEALTRLEWPADYLVVDTSSAPDSAELPRDNVARYGPLTVQFTPLEMDSQGRILARVRGWLGSVPITANAFSMHVVSLHPVPDPEAMLRSITDDQGRPYLFVPDEALRLLPDSNPGTDHLIYFAPFKPLTGDASLPHRLKVTLEVAPYATGKASGPGESSSLQQLILMDRELTWNVALPTRPTPLTPGPYLFKGWRERAMTMIRSIPSLDIAVATARTDMQQALLKR